jgi:hypothetical protein
MRCWLEKLVIKAWRCRPTSKWLEEMEYHSQIILIHSISISWRKCSIIIINIELRLLNCVSKLKFINLIFNFKEVRYRNRFHLIRREDSVILGKEEIEVMLFLSLLWCQGKLLRIYFKVKCRIIWLSMRSLRKILEINKNKLRKNLLNRIALEMLPIIISFLI